MKHKIGTVIDEDLFRRVKRRALDARRPLSDLIQDALEQYLATAAPDAAKAPAAYRVFCEQPIHLGPQHLRAVLTFTRGSLRGRIP